MFKEVDIHCIHQEKHLLAASSDHFTINTSNKISTTHLLTDLTILFPNISAETFDNLLSMNFKRLQSFKLSNFD